MPPKPVSKKVAKKVSKKEEESDSSSSSSGEVEMPLKQEAKKSWEEMADKEEHDAHKEHGGDLLEEGGHEDHEDHGDHGDHDDHDDHDDPDPSHHSRGGAGVKHNTNSVIHFNYEQYLALNTGVNTLTTNDLLKVAVARSHVDGQFQLCKILKHTLRAMNGECEWPDTSNYRPPRSRMGGRGGGRGGGSGGGSGRGRSFNRGRQSRYF